MTPLVLTRFLYPKDEAELSLLTDLLKNEDIEIIYYWAYELYYSGFDIFPLLWKIYLDFYYVLNPQFESYLKKKHLLWLEDRDMKHIAYVLRNMHNLQTNGLVFIARQWFVSDKVLYPTAIYRFNSGIIPEWLQIYEKKYYNLILSMKNYNLENILYHLNNLANTCSIYDIATVIGQYLHIRIHFDTRINTELHYLIALISKELFIVNSSVNNTYIDNNNIIKLHKKHLFVSPKQEHLDRIIHIEEAQIPLTKYNTVPVYDTLLHKRFTCIDDTIGCFKLARWHWNTHGDFVREQWFHWEYYAMGSPLWLNRLKTFGGFVNHSTKKIEFHTEKGEEGFYDLYAYELDELPKEVQSMTMKPLLNTGDGSLWYQNVFGETITEDIDMMQNWDY